MSRSSYSSRRSVDGRAVCAGMASLAVWLTFATASADEQWRRHTIDASSRGADGVRLEDVDDDGRLDVVTGWEEGGVVRLYLRESKSTGSSAWRTIDVANVGSPEDAVALPAAWLETPSIVSASEGATRKLLLHRASGPIGALESPSWRTIPLATNAPTQRWMFATPADLGARGGRGVFTGTKGENASVGWQSFDGLDASDRPVDWIRLADAGWIMSLVLFDFDSDGDDDLLFTDRKGPTRGLRWLENQSGAASSPVDWPKRRIGLEEAEPMFLSVQRFPDGKVAIAVALAAQEIAVFVSSREEPSKFAERRLKIPDSYGTGKGVRWADLNADGRLELAFSCERAEGERSGVGYFAGDAVETGVAAGSDDLRVVDVGGPEGTKFDRLEAVDMDDDGDLDLLTCEERDGLGVVWYENPLR